MSTVEEAQAASVQVPPAQAVKARGYWELIWIRLRRDKVAIAGGIFIIFMFLVAFVGAPIASHILGHGPNDQFFDAVDADTFLPVGPMTHVKTPDGGTTLFILGADSTIGRDLFLRLLYGAQTSLEVAVFATFFSIFLGVLLGALAGYFRGGVDTVVSRLTEMIMLPVVTILGMDIALALGGAIFTESIFGLPGLGRSVIVAYEATDLPVIVGVVVFSTVVIILFNLIVDCFYALIDPRIRLT